jgi:hypothetical protein
MAIGSSQITGEQESFFERGLVPNSSNIKKGYVVAHVSLTDDKLVDLPNAAGALLGGRAYAGVSVSANITNENNTPDNHLLVQRLGIANCLLSSGSTCTAGDYAAYDPANGGAIVPYTSTTQVVIGKFTQTKTAQSFEQFVGVFLQDGLGAGSTKGVPPLGKITSVVGPISNTALETVLASLTVPANYVNPGSTFRLFAKASVAGGNGTDTLTLRVRLDNVAGTLLATSPAVDVVNAGGDIGIIDLTGIVGAAGNVISTFGTAGISPGQAVAAGGNVQTTGSGGYVPFNPAVSHGLVITAQWSAASPADSMTLESAILSG